MSAAAAPAQPTATPTTAHSAVQLDTYRDDGPLARRIGRDLGRTVKVPAVALLLLAALPLVIVMALEGETATKLQAGLLVAWILLVAGASSARPLNDGLRWTAPPLLRAIEYAALLWLGAIGDALPAAFAFVAVIAFRHYEMVYRLRYQGVSAPRWVADAAGGWDGRLLLAYVLLVLGLLPGGLYAVAALLAVLLAGETVRSWATFGRTPSPDVYDDEEEDAE